MKKFLSLTIVFLMILVTVPAVAQIPTGYILRTMGDGTVALSDEQAYSGLWSAKMTTTNGSTDAAMVRFEYAPGFKLDDLHTLGYCEYVVTRFTVTVVDVFADIWLDFNGNGTADAPGDYPGYLQAEQYYTIGAAPLGIWVCVDAMSLKWSTYIDPDDPFDAPTIYHFQDPISFPGCLHGYDMDDWTNSVDFGNLDILRVDVRVGYGGRWDNFTGYADFVQINNYIENFEQFDSPGDCISALISAYCSDLQGRDRAECVQEQIAVCHDMYSIPSAHTE